jgi:histidine triad (HIT) family protein
MLGGAPLLSAWSLTTMAADGTNFWDPCWACRVLGGTAKGVVVTETSAVAVLMNPFPLNVGHALVVPRRHVRNLYEMPEELAGPILSMAARVARAAKHAFTADGITLRQNNDAASDQHLFHFHLHVIPRLDGDHERFSAPPQLVSLAEQESAAVRLRTALSRDDAEL